MIDETPVTPDLDALEHAASTLMVPSNRWERVFTAPVVQWLVAEARAARELSDANQHYAADLHSLECERDKLAAFKEWVHAYLDNLGVPKEFPAGPHTREGCRIGDRMDWWRAKLYAANDNRFEMANKILAAQAEVERLAAATAELAAALEPFSSWPIYEGESDDTPSAVRGTTGRLVIGDFRRAAETLARHAKEGA